jgi:hypothetical protein
MLDVSVRQNNPLRLVHHIGEFGAKKIQVVVRGTV